MPAAITDCDHVCTRCGEHLAECNLCQGLPSALVFRPQRPSREDERELAAQERAIRRAADRRQGWL